jgi:hypothetical protein
MTSVDSESDFGPPGVQPAPSNPGTVASSIESITNAILLTGVDIDQAGYIIRPGRFPSTFMPSLLHESAHWDTFDTPVGRALALLFLRAWQRAHFIANDVDEPAVPNSSLEVAIDFTRYELATEILRPLCEGIALFSEFDLQPMDSPVTTTPTILSGMVFGNWYGRQSTEGLTLGQLATVHMKVARSHELFRARKENLLCQTFRTENGGYLPGYYFVKNLRNYLVSRRRLVNLLDGDLFLFILKSVIFGDLELARLLVDPELDFMFSVDEGAISRDAVNAVLTHFQKQMQFVVHDLDAQFVKRVESIVGRDEPWSWVDLQRGIDGNRLAENIEVLSRVSEDLADESRFITTHGRRTTQIISHLLENRDLLCLASFTTNIEVNEHGRCLIGSFITGDWPIPYLSIPARPGFTNLHGKGTYEIYFLVGTVGRKLCFSVVLGDECVACGAVYPDTEFDIEMFAERKPSLALTARIQREMEDNLRNVMEDDPAFEHYKVQIGELVSKIYDTYCRGFVEQLYKGDFGVISGNDLVTIAGDDSAFLCDYAAISLQRGMFTREELQDECNRLRINTNQFMAKLADWKANKRFALSDEIAGLTILTL